MALSDITPGVSVEHSKLCSTLTITDTSEYGGCADPDEFRGDVTCRSLVMRNVCTGALVDLGGTAQEVCFNIPASVLVGDVYTINIGSCSFEITVASSDVATSDEIRATGSFTVSTNGTPGGVANFQFPIINATLLLPVAVTVQATANETALVLATALNARALAEGLDAYISFTAVGANIEISVSGAWYQTTQLVPVNGDTVNAAVTGGGGTAISYPGTGLYDGYVPATFDVDARTKQNVYTRLADIIGSTTDCPEAIAVVLSACDDECPIRIRSTVPGFGFAYSSTGARGVAPLAFDNELIVANSCNMLLPSVPNSDTKTIPYPGDGIYEIGIRLYDEDGFITAAIYQGVLCQLKNKYATVLYNEVIECCDKQNCLPEANNLRNYIAAIEDLVAMGDYPKACQVFGVITAPRPTDCYPCGN
jgi:hypothetical protein